MTAPTSASLDTGVLAALGRLDGTLAQAVAVATALYGPDAATDPYRGLVVTPDEVERLLAREPGRPLFGTARLPADDLPDPPAAPGGELAWLAGAFGLMAFDVHALVVALAPDVDLRYERIYGFLHDDVTRRRASVDLVLDLLCATDAERIEARARFAPDAPLVRNGLVDLVADSQEPSQPLLKRTLRVDEQIVRFLLGESTLDHRLAGCATLDRGDGRPGHPGDPLAALPHLTDEQAIEPPRLYLQGARGRGQRHAAFDQATRAGRPLLTLDLERALAASTPVTTIVRVAFREAWLRRLAILVEGVDAVRHDPGALDALVAETTSSRVPTMLAGTGPWPPAGCHAVGATGVVVVPFPEPDLHARRTWWQAELGAAGLRLAEADVDAIADRYHLGPAGISEAVRSARNEARWSGRPACTADVAAAARRQSGHDLDGLARKVPHVLGWDDLILPDEARAQLLEMRTWVAHRRRVLHEWGFGRSLPLGSGISALFTGPSGTGKTMAAGVVAGDLGLDLYKIDLSTVVSKYIGETEKNLERIFTAAEHANAVLFFDEADAIFGKRSAVHDAHDRYANIEIAYLLQRMEQYDGLAILATNVREHVDDAFLRRVQFIVEFPVPDRCQRERMWREFIPAGAPVDAAVDYPFLAEQFRLAGGNIKNVVVSAAYLASASGGRIDMGHLVRASWREHQKIGRVLSRSDLGEYAALLPGRDPATGGVA